MTPERFAQLAGVRYSNGSGIGRCPLHSDKRQRLSVKAGDNGRVLVKCFSGCALRDIVHSLGLQMTDLFPSEHPQERRMRQLESRIGRRYSERVIETIQVLNPGLVHFSKRQIERLDDWIESLTSG